MRVPQDDDDTVEIELNPLDGKEEDEEVEEGGQGQGQGQRQVQGQGRGRTLQEEGEKRRAAGADGRDEDDDGADLESAVSTKGELHRGGFLSIITFAWLKPLMELGNQRPLEMEDLWELAARDRASEVYTTFRRHWDRARRRKREQLEEQLAKGVSVEGGDSGAAGADGGGAGGDGTHLSAKGKEKARAAAAAARAMMANGGDTPSLAMVLVRSFGQAFFGAGCYKFIHDCCLFVGPQLLKAIIDFLGHPERPLYIGLFFVLGLFLANVTMSLCLRQYFWWCFRTGMRLRSCVVTATFAKALQIADGALRRRGTGEITNLMSVDSTRLAELTPYLHAIWYSFFQIAVALFFLWREVGPSCLGGIAVIILTIPLSGAIAKRLKSLQKELMKVKDERIKINTEVLSGMKVIKLQAWEHSYEARILEVRERELGILTRFNFVKAASGAIWTATPLFVAVATFMSYTAAGNELDVGTALTSLALFDILRFPLYMLPNVINNLVEAKVSVDRVQSFLGSKDKKPVSRKPLHEEGVMIRNGTFVYDGKRPPRSRYFRAKEIAEDVNPMHSGAGIGAATNPLLHGDSLGDDYGCDGDDGSDDESGHFTSAVAFGGGASPRGRDGDGTNSNNSTHGADTASLVDEDEEDWLEFWGLQDYLDDDEDGSGFSYSETESLQNHGQSQGGVLREQQQQRNRVWWLRWAARALRAMRHSYTRVRPLLASRPNEESGDADPEMSEEEFDNLIKAAQLHDAETVIAQLEEELELLRGNGTTAARVASPHARGEVQRRGAMGFGGMMEAGGAIDGDGGFMAEESGSGEQKESGEDDQSQQQSAVGTAGAAADGEVRERLLPISRIAFRAAMGEIVAVVGQVGSGKSSLVAALLGELRKVSGVCAVRGRVAYVGQRPFIQNATLRNNVTFGLPFNAARYHRVLKSCALLPDLAVLPAGDRTEIGEKGINLSGGQKARVALARAVYSDADVYILDDPLAAVDTHVGEHLFKRCIKRQLQRRGKCVVLVTNALQFLPAVDRIAVMSDGHIIEHGTYESLMVRASSRFATLMRTFSDTGAVSGEAAVADGATAAAGTAAATPASRGTADSDTAAGTNGGAGAAGGATPIIGGTVVPTGPLISVDLSDDGSKAGAATDGVLGAAAAAAAMDGGDDDDDDDDDDDAVEEDTFDGGSKVGGNTIGSLSTLPLPESVGTRRRERTTSSEGDWDPNELKGGQKDGGGGGGTMDGTGGSKGDKESGQLMQTEEREVGSVSWRVYTHWLLATGGILAIVGMFIIFGIGESSYLITQWWLGYWSEHRDDPNRSAWFFLGIYTAINLMTCFIVFIRLVVLYDRGLQASRHLFQGILHTVLQAPMHFFDTTPIGRVINRFSKDIYTVDEQIPMTMRMYLGTMIRVVAVICFIVIVTPFFLLALIPVVGFYIAAQRYYIRTSRELKRLDSVSRSPIYALFGETLDGLSTIRAFRIQDQLTLRNNDLLDRNQRAYFLIFSANCWLAVRLELVGTLIITMAALFAVLEHGRGNGDAFAAMAGLSISFALSVTQSLNWSVRMASDLEAQMVSVERVKEYAEMETEAPHMIPERDPPSSWPANGAIEIRNLELRYRPGLPLVLKGLNLSIRSREKIGVVGRTGAGKSSLVLALLRIVEPERGEVLIDGVDVAHIGLNALRSKMAVIPQDPVLFSGTIRTNLDPFGKHQDGALWEGLRRTRLDECITTLEDEVEENGANFSVGQRQLLCIARALLSQARIIIMDEATAAVDVETDALIQNAVRSEFEACTVLCIAHRLNTIMDSDRVLVMDDGCAAEFDTPKALLNRPKGIFAELVQHWEQEEQDQQHQQNQ